MNKFKDKPERDEEKVVQLSAGVNHSMAISESGRCFSWGYAGKGLLGRNNLNYSMISSPIGTGQKKEHSYTMKIGLSGFIQKYVKDKMKASKGPVSSNEAVSNKNAYYV